MKPISKIFSSSFNHNYFSPEVTYRPWASSLADANFSAARNHPISGENGFSEFTDLTGAFYAVETDTAGFSGSAPISTGYTSGANGMVDGWDDYTLYQIQGSQVARWSVTHRASGTGGATRTVTSLSPITNSSEVAAIQKNFANWFQYHRRRSFTLNYAVSSIIDQIPNFRYSLGFINSDTMLAESPAVNYSFDDHNKKLLDALYSHDQQSVGTPLRSGLERVGNYLKRTDSNAPITDSCQKNFALLFTDGFWGGKPPSSTIGDEDGDGNSQTVADIALYFYDNDLRTDLSNDVPSGTSTRIQHMTTFVVAFGVQGNLTDSDNDGWPEIDGKAPDQNSNWGNPLPFSAYPAKIDDLWHAAFNSNGVYMEAKNPSDIVNSLNQALTEIQERLGSTAAVAVNVSRLSTDNFFYQTQFNTRGWSGDLIAYAFDLQGDVMDKEKWRSGSFINGSSFNHNSRVVITADSSPLKGQVFRYNNLSSTYKNLFTSRMTDLKASGNQDSFGTELVNYLRGKKASTISAYDFRDRTSLLGDMVNSSPVYVGPPSRRVAPYNTSSYTSFRSTHSARTPIIYVGANDGMLHAFNAATGREVMAFVPNSVAKNLFHLADPDYEHQYYVDGPITVEDACLGNSVVCAWSSVLAAGFGTGAKGIYALDVTKPNDFFESKAGNIFLWEMTENDDDVGHIYGKPTIVKLHNGEWGVVSGNGYNSKNGLAKLLILNAKTGARIATISTDTTVNNGLSTATVVDVNRDGVADSVYAGDLQGNLWKFDINDANPSKWSSAYSSGNAPVPLYKGGSGKPITSAPQVGRHSELSGYMVYFGSGKYLEFIDNSSTGQTTQGFHGIWDRGNGSGLPITDSQLLVQNVERELVAYPKDTNGDGLKNSSDESSQFRLTSRNSICWTNCTGTTHKGWRLDLAFNGSNRGEKVIADAILRNNRIIFTTMQPSVNSCERGARSWLMELNASNGSSTIEVVFDINNDGVLNYQDRDLNNWTSENISSICPGGKCYPPTGIYMKGMISSPTIVSNGGVEYKLISKSDSTVESIAESDNSAGRQSWRELIDE